MYVAAGGPNRGEGGANHQRRCCHREHAGMIAPPGEGLQWKRVTVRLADHRRREKRERMVEEWVPHVSV